MTRRKRTPSEQAEANRAREARKAEVLATEWQSACDEALRRYPGLNAQLARLAAPVRKRAWFVIYTRPASEMRVEADLEEAGVETYLVRETRWCRHARRKTRVQRPAFTRYLFVALDAETPDFATVADTVGVDGFVTGATTEPRRVPDALIAKLQEAENGGRFDYTRERVWTKGDDLKAGQSVKIVAGVLKGFDATILQVLGRRNVRILYSMLGRQDEVIIAAASLDVAPEAQPIASELAA